MKLDKIRFATLIGYLSRISGQTFAVDEIVEIDGIIDVPVPEPVVSPSRIDELLTCMITANEAGFIPAIKAYRSLTGSGLKESKEAIEKYRQPVKKQYDPADLRKALKDARYDNDSDYYAVERFLNNL